MKKSTILMVVVVYIIAFFVVGLMGMQLRSHYSVSYLNEIQVVPTEQTSVVLESDETEEIGDKNEIKTYRVLHSYKYRASYSKDMALRFYVKLVPSETTVSDFQFSYIENKLYKIEKIAEDNSLKIYDIKKITGTFTSVKFEVKDSQQHGVKTSVIVDIL